jgi:hypothetical protein
VIDHLIDVSRTVVHPGTVLAPTVLLILLLAPLAWLAARHAGGLALAAAAAVVSLVAIADLTVLRPGLLHAHAEWSHVAAVCAVTDPSWLNAESLLNVALFVPAAFFAVLAVGRAAPAALWAVTVVVGSAVLSLGIEATQAAYGIGTCDSSDVVHNVTGALIGAVLALAALAVLAALTPRPHPTSCSRSRALLPLHR